MLIEQCKGYVDATMPRLVHELMLESWDITVNCFARIDGDDLADCILDTDYKTAVIRIDADKINNSDELDTVLYHELSHIILAPIEFYRSLKAHDNELEQKLWTNALENTVTHLERIFMQRGK